MHGPLIGCTVQYREYSLCHFNDIHSLFGSKETGLRCKWCLQVKRAWCINLMRTRVLESRYRSSDGREYTGLCVTTACISGEVI